MLDLFDTVTAKVHDAVKRVVPASITPLLYDFVLSVVFAVATDLATAFILHRLRRGLKLRDSRNKAFATLVRNNR